MYQQCKLDRSDEFVVEMLHMIVQQILTQTHDRGLVIAARPFPIQVFLADSLTERYRGGHQQLAGLNQLADHLSKFCQPVSVELLPPHARDGVISPVFREDP